MKEHLRSQTGATGFTIQQGRSLKRMSKDEEISKVDNTWADEDAGWCRTWPFLPGSARFCTGRYYWIWEKTNQKDDLKMDFYFISCLKKKRKKKSEICSDYLVLMTRSTFQYYTNVICIFWEVWCFSRDDLRWVQSSFQAPPPQLLVGAKAAVDPEYCTFHSLWLKIYLGPNINVWRYSICCPQKPKAWNNVESNFKTPLIYSFVYRVYSVIFLNISASV